jgi:SAM-dependent methyltransferase
MASFPVPPTLTARKSAMKVFTVSSRVNATPPSVYRPSLPDGWFQSYGLGLCYIRSEVITPAPLRPLFRTGGLADWLRQLAGKIRGTRPAEQSRHPFDVPHGVDTSGLLYADALTTGHPHDRYSEGYYATAPSLFHGALARWQVTLSNAPLEDYTFIDLGSGKGRVLLMASDYPFRAVMGVELNAKLARVARRNLAKWMRSPHACRAVSAVQGDVLETPIPDGPLVLFLFNAFEAQIVTALLERLVAASRARTAPIDLIYIHPEHDALVRQTPGMQLLADENIAFSPEDAAADAFQVNVDQCCIYRLKPGTL